METYEHILPGGAQLKGYLRDETAEMPQYNARPAVVVMPGGGYHHLSPRESDPVAMQFLAAGYQVFILYYTVRQLPGGAPLGWQALTDAAAAICHIRANAAQLRVVPDKIAVCGFSAGGHLAASSAILADDEVILKAIGIKAGQGRPNAAILCYPVITTGEYRHPGSIENLAGNNAEWWAKFSLENQIKPGLPPFFIWHTIGDDTVPVQNSLMLAQALSENNVPYELHLYPQGGHGTSLCNNETQYLNAHNSGWMSLCREWLEITFDYHI